MAVGVSLILTPADWAVLLAWVVVLTVTLAVARRNLRAAGSRAISPSSFGAGVAGLAVIGVSLTPSVGDAAEPAFASHMVQHLALGLAAPILIVVGRVPELALWAVTGAHRRSVRRSLGRLGRPPRSVVWPTAAMVVVWFGWHVPAFYGAAIEVPVVHAVEHLSVLGVGCWYWAAIAPHRRRTGAVVAASFTLVVALGLLGAALTLSDAVFYADHVTAATPAARLQDQQLGGLLMWTPGGLVYLAAAVVQLVRWLDLDAGGRSVRVTAGRSVAP